MGGCFAAVILAGRVDALPPCLCCCSPHLWRCSFLWQVQLLVGISLASVRVVRVVGFSPVLLLLLGVCVVFGCLFVFLQFFLYFYSFVILCWSSSVWPHQELSVNCFLLNEIRAQARSRKKRQRKRLRWWGGGRDVSLGSGARVVFWAHRSGPDGCCVYWTGS